MFIAPFFPLYPLKSENMQYVNSNSFVCCFLLLSYDENFRSTRPIYGHFLINHIFKELFGYAA